MRKNFFYQLNVLSHAANDVRTPWSIADRLEEHADKQIHKTSISLLVILVSIILNVEYTSGLAARTHADLPRNK